MTSKLDDIRTTCCHLMELIENQADCKVIGEAQKAFVQSVQIAMEAYRNGEIQVELRSLPGVMYDFVVNELPDLCSADRETLVRSLKKIRLFLNTMEQLVRPTELSSNNQIELSKSI